MPLIYLSFMIEYGKLNRGDNQDFRDILIRFYENV